MVATRYLQRVMGVQRAIETANFTSVRRTTLLSYIPILQARIAFCSANLWCVLVSH